MKFWGYRLHVANNLCWRPKSGCTPIRPRQLVAGLSPHAPYSVHWDVILDAAIQATRHNLPIAIHVAETHPSLELLANTGAVCAVFTGIGDLAGGRTLQRADWTIFR